jgi:quercetin dioxygenase-like cupin family protein
VNTERLKELAAGYATGELELAERGEFQVLLQSASDSEREAAAAVIDTAALVSLARPLEGPSPALRQRLMSRIGQSAVAKPPELLKFIRGADNSVWIPLKVPGAYVKVLSMEESRGHAVVLGKLDPGAHYPAHDHIGGEEIYVLSGDLFIGEVKLVAGDFHSAAPGSRHEVNHSEQGCTILAVLTKKDLMRQFAAA